MPQIEQIIERVMSELHQIVKTETVIGEPLQTGSITIIPVSKISFGFAAGSGKKEHSQSGTGGGATVEPIAFLVIDETGKIQVTPISDRETSIGHLVELVPEAFEKIKRFVEKNRSGPTNEPKRNDGN
tara:strand:+ start:1106 stop:1489 length:384 start_codon:yes stop_codon:yes gene_type:complete